MRSTAFASLLLLVLLASGCADRTPAGFKYDLPTAVTGASYFPLSVSVVNKKGEVIKSKSASLSASPADVLEVATNGTLRCAKTGDATLTLTSGGFSQPVAIKCRIPTEIEVPRELLLIMGKAPTALHTRALGEGSKPLDDVTVEVTSSDPSIVAAEGDTVRGVAVGKARLQSTLGGITSVTSVEVHESVISEALTLRDGASSTFTLQPANYLIVVELKPDERLKQGVTLTWSGTGCENQIENTSHRVPCRVSETATLTVTNPKLMGVGAPVKGTLDVFRVPD